MKKLRIKRKSLGLRAFLASLVVSLSVLLLLSLFLLVWFRNEMTGGYRELTETALGNTDASFSKSITEDQNMTAEWFSSAAGASLRLNPEADYIQHMDFINKVRATLDNSSYMQSFCIINVEKEVALNVGSNTSYPDQLPELLLEQLEQMEEKYQPFIWLAPNRYKNESEIPILSIPVTESLFSSENFTGMAVLNIDLNQFQKFLFGDQENSRFRLMILDPDGVVMSHSISSYIGEDWSGKDWVQRILNGESSFVMKDEEGRWEFRSQKANKKGFYLVAQSDYMAQILNINVLLIVAAAVTVAVIVIVLMLFLVSKRVFRPFDSMVGDLKQSQLAGELSAAQETEQDEVGFLEQVYQGMYSRLESLKEKKESDFIVKNLLLGNQQQETLNLLKDKGIIREGLPYTMILVYVENEEGAEPFGMQEYDMLRTMVSNIYTAVFENYGFCSSLELGLRRILFFVSGKKEELTEAAKSAGEKIQRVSTAKCYCILSESLSDDGAGCIGYFKELNDCLKTRHLLELEEPLVLPAQAEKQGHWKPDSLIDALKNREKKEYLAEAGNFLDSLSETGYPQAVNEIEWLAGTILRTGKVSRDNLKETIESFGSRDELYLWLESLFDEAAIQISKGSGRSTAVMMEEAVDYIRSNYGDSNLGVNLLAERLGISTAYFGKLFNEFTGTKTLDYILKVRMEKAQELLLGEPDKSIAQVAEEVGYNNSTYFTTAFKKFYGVTPSRFREYSYTMTEK